MAMKRNKVILSTLLLFFVVEIAWVFAWNGLLGNRNGLHIGPWQIAEWFINYEGGFVRRGLSGQLLYWLSNGSSLLVVLYTFAFASLLIYSLIFILAYYLAEIKKPSLLILALLLPGGIFQMGTTLQFFTRKEILFLIAFGIQCCMYLWASRSDGVAQKRILLLLSAFSFVVSVPLMMIHEAYLFMGFPFALILLWLVKTEQASEPIFMRIWWVYLILMPALFIVLGVNHGDAQIASHIWQSLPLEDREMLSPAAPYTAFGPIASIGWGLQQHILTIYGIFATSGWVYWPIFIIGNGLALGYVVRQLAIRNGLLISRLIFLTFIAVLMSASMYVIAADWGRWTSFITNSALLLVFTLSKSVYVNELSIDASRWGKQWNNKLYYVILLIYSLSLRLPECCISPKYFWMPWGGF